MNKLRPNNVSNFLQRFSALGDGVIISFCCGFHSEDAPTIVDMRITVHDWQMYEPGRARHECRATLRLRFVDTTEFALTEDRNGHSHHVIFEASLAYFDGLFFLNLDNSELDLSSPEGYRASRFYVAARALEWEVLPYAE